MTPATLRDPEEPLVSSQTPYLSHSRLSRYLHCPEQYRLYYIENLRPRHFSANLAFGQAVHEALAELFRTGGDPVKRFQDQWQTALEMELDYGARDSWEKLKTTGEILLARFAAEELPNLSEVSAIEKVFELGISNLDLPFVGIIDLVANFNGKRTVIDFKTAAQSFDDHEVVLSDQLSAYQLAEPTAQRVALCVLIKSRVPKIEWHLTSRTSQQLTEYLSKAGLIAREITAGHFYKRPGRWCAWCDFLPVCIGDNKRTEEHLIRVERAEYLVERGEKEVNRVVKG
jgi:hypothetical protein